VSKAIAFCILTGIILFGCGGGGGGGGGSAATGTTSNSSVISSGNDTPVTTTATGIFVDSPVNGLEYTGSPSGRSGITGESGVDGQFIVALGDTVTFKIGNLTLGSAGPVSNGNIFTPATLAGNSSNPLSPLAIRIAQLLHSLDADRNSSSGILIPEEARVRLRDGSVNTNLLQSALQNGQNYEATLGGIIDILTRGNANRNRNEIVPASTVSAELQITVQDANRGVVMPVNRAPVADMADPTVVGEHPYRLRFDGSPSFDPDNDPLTYFWVLLSKPAAANASFTQTNTATPTLTAPLPGEYIVGLHVSDPRGLFDIIAIQISLSGENPANSAPIADAGEDRFVTINSNSIFLDGSSSFDPDNDSISYHWTVVSKPAGANFTLSQSMTATPGFNSNIPGEYVFQLRVTDTPGLSSVDTVKITLEQEDVPVVQLAPYDVNRVIGESIHFDASSSYDPDGASLSYTWRVNSLPDDSGIPVVYSGPAPAILFDVHGTYNIEVEVSNGSNSSFVQLEPIDVTLYNKYQLSHIATDAEYDKEHRRVITLSGNKVYSINVDTGVETSIPLSLAGAAISLAPDGNHAAVAHNGWISHIDLNTNTVLAVHSVPADLGDVVIDNNGYAYGFPASDQWVSMLIVNMATGASQVHGGSPIREDTRAKLHPDGSKIYGADNGLSPSDIERYNIGGGNAQLVYDSPYHGDYPFCGDLWIEPAGNLILTACRVVVRSANQHPSDMSFVMQLDNNPAEIQYADMNDFTDEWLVLDRSITPQHAVISGSDYVQTYDLNSGTRRQRFYLPRIESDITKRWFGKFVFAAQSSNGHFAIAVNNTLNPTNSVLLVSKDFEYSASNRPPAAVAPRFKTNRVFDSVRVDGNASSDPEGMPLTYHWNLINQPAGSNVSLYDTTSPETYFTPEIAGVYELGLVVNDGTRNSPMARVDVNVFSASSSLVHRLDNPVQDAEYSGALNSLVYIVPNDTSLYLLNLTNFTEQQVELGQIPYKVGVAPDGLKAAVSHSGKVTLIDLQTMSVIDTQDYSADWGDVVLDHHDRANIIPDENQWVSLYTMDFSANSTSQTSGSVRAGTQIRMHPTEDWIYGANRGLSPSDFEKYDLTNYPAIIHDDSPYHGDYSISGNIWISEAGNRLLVAGARVFHSSSNPLIDMTYTGALPDNIQVLWASHSVEARQWAVITGNDSNPSLSNKLFLYTDDFFNRQSLSSFSPIPTPQGNVTAIANASSRVFYNEDGTKVILITYGTGLANGYAVEIRNLQ